MAVAAFTALVQTVATMAGGTAFASMTFFGATGFSAYLAMTATYAVLGAVSRELFAQPSLDTMNGINFNVRDPAATRKIIYGKCRVGGAIVFFNTSDTDNNFLHLVIAVAGHEIESYEEVYFGDQKVWGNGSYVDDGTTDWEDHCLLSFHKGDQTAADTTLVDAATGFTSNHKLLGTAYVYVRLDYNAEVYVSGVPNISFVVKGKKILNPSNASTAYSNNPALIAYDYLRDTEYGLGESAANIDTASVIASAAVCDTIINITGGTQKAFECDGVLDSGTNIKENLEAILSSMIGSVSYYNGKFSIIAHKHYTPVSDAVETSMIVSPIQVSTKRSRKSQHNTVKGQFISEENNYIVSDYPIQKNASYITQDGEEMPLNLTLAMTTNNVRAQRIAKLVMEKSRQQMTISMELNLNGLKYAVGDNIKINYARFSWSNKEFEITKLQLIPDPERGMIVAVEAVENSSSAYTWSAGDALDFVIAPAIDVYSGTDVVAPTSLNVYKHPDNVDRKFRFTWAGVEEADNANPSEPYLDYYEVLFHDGSLGYKDFSETTTETHLDIILDHVNDRNQQHPWYVTVKAINVRGYSSSASNEMVVTVRDYGDFAPDPRQDNFVQGTSASPTVDDINALALAKGIEIVNSTVITYLQVDSANVILNTTEFVFEDGSILPVRNAGSITESGLTTNTELMHDFSQGWLLGSDEIEIVNGVLVGTDVVASSFAAKSVNIETITGNITVETTIDSLTINGEGAVNITIYNQETHAVMAQESYTTAGTKTFTFDTNTTMVLVVVQNLASLDTVDYEISKISMKHTAINAFEEYKFYTPSWATTEVTWVATNQNQIGITDSGVTYSVTGITGDNLIEDERKYVAVRLERSSASVGFSQTTIELSASWIEPEIMNGVTTNLVKSATITKTLSARIT
jgi:hypothetical protein